METSHETTETSHTYITIKLAQHNEQATIQQKQDPTQYN